MVAPGLVESTISPAILLASMSRTESLRLIRKRKGTREI
jgi:hypothetical protein